MRDRACGSLTSRTRLRRQNRRGFRLPPVTCIAARARVSRSRSLLHSIDSPSSRRVLTSLSASILAEGLDTTTSRREACLTGHAWEKRWLCLLRGSPTISVDESWFAWRSAGPLWLTPAFLVRQFSHASP